ncbi:DNA-processing protein DprA [Kurthia massiliensis]|uniref:DNA-processing protein DprA n=1 Tax=Kurthia massiliensis TaxID=1033739 RepID=UPI000289CFE9|nr:DNA-processing protein DprA [Kurthia massiliensis]
MDNTLLALHYVWPKPITQLYKLLQTPQTLTHLFDWTPQQLKQQLNVSLKKAQYIYEKLQAYRHVSFLSYYAERHITPIHFFDPRYPALLKEIYDPPAVIYVKGQPSLLAMPKKIAVVGTRKATHYSKKALEQLLPPLINDEIAIVSGLARGADKMAHELTITLGGATIAVLGHGFDYMYPREHQYLYEEMATNHLLVTEYPPYMGPRKWQFPMRNRLISGLSCGIIITEAMKKSGTLSTVEYGLNHGREIFVVPGDISSPFSELPHELASDGAKIVWNGTQILDEIRHFSFLK